MVLTGCGTSPTASAAGPAPAAPDGVEAASIEPSAPAVSFQLIEHRRSGAEAVTLAQPHAKPARFHNTSSRTRSARSTAREQVLMLIRAAELRHRIPAGLLDALVAIESGYRPFAVSRAGAAGLAQLMPGTASDLGVIDRFDVRANLDGGARYLRAMLDRFGSVSLALAAYNAGPNAVHRSRGIPLNGETPSYVARVITRWREVTGGTSR